MPHIHHCPHCNQVINPASLLGRVRSEAKRLSSKINGHKGGRKASDQPRAPKPLKTQAIALPAPHAATLTEPKPAAPVRPSMPVLPAGVMRASEIREPLFRPSGKL